MGDEVVVSIPAMERSAARPVVQLPTAKQWVFQIAPGLLVAAEPEDDRDLDLMYQVASVVVCVGGDYAKGHRVDVPKGSAYLRCEFEDGEVPRARLVALATFLASLVDGGEEVLVHCAAGVNRSCLVAALVLRELTGCSGTAARIMVQTLRPGALKTPQYREYLDDLRALED